MTTSTIQIPGRRAAPVRQKAVLIDESVGIWLDTADGPIANMRLTITDAMVLSSELSRAAKRAEALSDARAAREQLTAERVAHLKTPVEHTEEEPF